MDKYSKIRQLLDSKHGRIVSVSFVKKDGTPRTMLVQPAAGKYRVKGKDASESAQKAAQTRAERYPNLLNVWDVDRKAFRSINMDTVTKIVADGSTYQYQ